MDRSLEKLPRKIRGPKLKPFEGNIENIEFKRTLSQENDRPTSDEGPHSRIFLVAIDGRPFALKVFKFFSLEEIRPFAPGKEGFLKDNVVRHQMDPFYAECRAFGQLVEKGRDDELAVRCHGYVFLTIAVEHQIERQYGFYDWNRKPDDEGSPLRAIIKDHIRWNSLCHRKTFAMMRRNIEGLNRLGIYNMDIREDNYRGGRLFDFSIAITSPHMSLSEELRSKEQIADDMAYDLGCFDSMVKRVEKQQQSATDESPSQKKWVREQGRIFSQ